MSISGSTVACSRVETWRRELLPCGDEALAARYMEIARAHCISGATIAGEPSVPKHQIVAEKLRRLGMAFGGQPLSDCALSNTVNGYENSSTGRMITISDIMSDWPHERQKHLRGHACPECSALGAIFSRSALAMAALNGSQPLGQLR